MVSVKHTYALNALLPQWDKWLPKCSQRFQRKRRPPIGFRTGKGVQKGYRHFCDLT